MSKKSVIRKIICFFVIVIFPINILLLLGTKSYISTLTSQQETSYYNLMELSMNNLDNKIYYIERYMYQLWSEDSDFIKLSLGKDSSATVLAQNKVYRELNNQVLINDIDGYFFYKFYDTEKAIIAFSGMDSEEHGKMQKVISEITQNGEQKQWSLYSNGSNTYIYKVWLFGNIIYGAILKGNAFLDDTLGRLEDLSFTDNFKADISLGFQKEDPGPDTDHISIKSNVSSLALTANIKYNNVFHRLTLFGKLEIILSFVYLLLIPVIYIWFKFVLIRPLKAIEKALNQLENGHREYRIQEDLRSAEFNHVAASFNEMSNQLEYLRIENYEKEIEREKIIRRNIQLQVRPHFILNIFNIIFNMAVLKNFVGIQHVAKFLSQYFREIFESDDFHELSMEMALIENYCNILEYQYPDMFKIEFDIDPRLYNYRIPTMILLELVENTAKYTLSPGDEIEICVRAHCFDSYVELSVMDDGIGIEAAVLERIQKNEKVIKKDGTHIGIWNSKKRLRMLYGDLAEMCVESEYGQGTKVIIKIYDDSFGGFSDEGIIS